MLKFYIFWKQPFRYHFSSKSTWRNSNQNLIGILCNHLISWTNKTTLKKLNKHFISIKKCFNSFIPSAWKITILLASSLFPLFSMRFLCKMRFKLKQSFMVTPVLFSWWSWFYHGPCLEGELSIKKYYKSISTSLPKLNSLKKPERYPPFTRLRKQVKLQCHVTLFSSHYEHERNQTKSKLNRGKITHFVASIFHRQLTMVATHAFSRKTISEERFRVEFSPEPWKID